MTVRPADRKRASNLDAALIDFDANVHPLKGVREYAARSVFVAQMIESLRRIEFVQFVRDNDIDPKRTDPKSNLFDPIRAAALKMRGGDVDEAFWLIFLSTHFGKHVRHGWGLVRTVYAGSNGQVWTWQRTSANIPAFRNWLSQNEAYIRSHYSFSNHRKYQSLSATSPVGTGAVIASYIAWISPPRTHQQFIRQIHLNVGQNPHEVFDALYKGMDAVVGFGRLGKFDFLTMLGKLGLAPIAPGSAYLVGATGPLQGAKLLFTNSATSALKSKELDKLLLKLDVRLNVGMQVLEDSLCNWQKSPRKFISFRG